MIKKKELSYTISISISFLRIAHSPNVIIVNTIIFIPYRLFTIIMGYFYLKENNELMKQFRRKIKK
jgi:hypothetical protein